MDTACVSQRAHSYNPEIHPKESLLGKQAKNNPEGSSTAQKQFFGGGGIQGTSSVAYGVIASNFFKFRVASGGGSCPPDPAFWVPRASSAYSLGIWPYAIFWWPKEGCGKLGVSLLVSLLAWLLLCGMWAIFLLSRTMIPEPARLPLCLVL